MRQHYRFTPIKTKDIQAIMRAVRSCGMLSGIAYCRLHNYIVTLERLLGEGAYHSPVETEILNPLECIFLNN